MSADNGVYIGEKVSKLADQLRYLANLYKAADPVGARTILHAASVIDTGQCAHCLENERSGYSRGYSAGYKRGCNEWTEGLPDSTRKENGE